MDNYRIKITTMEEWKLLAALYSRLGWRWAAGQHPRDWSPVFGTDGGHVEIQDRFHNTSAPQRHTVVPINAVLEELTRMGVDPYVIPADGYDYR